MKRLAGWVLVALLALGCEEEDTTATAQEPAPVTPVEVTAGEGEAQPSELEQLRARVAELEQQLATCQQAQPATQTAAIPEGVDVPAPEGETPPATPTATAQNDARDAGTARNRRRRDPNLMDTILGEDGRRRQGDDETIELPNPANILLGN